MTSNRSQIQDIATAANTILTTGPGAMATGRTESTRRLIDMNVAIREHCFHTQTSSETNKKRDPKVPFARHAVGPTQVAEGPAADTQMPPQSAPPWAGMQSSVGSSTHTVPSAQRMPAKPPQWGAVLGSTQKPGQSEAWPQPLAGLSTQMPSPGHAGKPREPQAWGAGAAGHCKISKPQVPSLCREQAPGPDV
jgi:hypothetical protein